MENNTTNKEKQHVTRAVAHDVEDAEVVLASEYLDPPPLFIASNPAHVKKEVEGEEKDQKLNPAEITDQNDQTNSPDPLGADMKAEGASLQANAPVKEDEKEEEIKDAESVELVFADDSAETPNEEGDDDKGAGGLGDDSNADDGNNNPLQKKEGNPAASSPKGYDSIPDNIMSKMESSFGHDFSQVKIHSDSSSAKKLGALAHTQGHDIHFAPGTLDLESHEGLSLLGHELAHVVQQAKGLVSPTTVQNNVAVNNDPNLESEADDLGFKAANFVLSGQGSTNGISNLPNYASNVSQLKSDPSSKHKPVDVDEKGIAQEIIKKKNAHVGKPWFENYVTDEIFYLRYPSLERRKLVYPNNSGAEKELVKDWLRIRNDVVRPLLKREKPSEENPENETPEQGQPGTGNPGNGGGGNTNPGDDGGNNENPQQDDPQIENPVNENPESENPSRQQPAPDSGNAGTPAIEFTLNDAADCVKLIMELARLVPVVGPVPLGPGAGLIAGSIQALQDAFAVGQTEDPILAVLLGMRNGTSIANGLLGDVSYIVSLLEDLGLIVGAGATGATGGAAAPVAGGIEACIIACNEVASIINVVGDIIVLGLDITILAYTGASLAMSPMNDDQRKAYEGILIGYIGNTGADLISLIADVFDAASGGLLQGEIADKGLKALLATGNLIKYGFKLYAKLAEVFTGIVTPNVTPKIVNAVIQNKEEGSENQEQGNEEEVSTLTSSLSIADQCFEMMDDGVDVLIDTWSSLVEKAEQKIEEVSEGRDPFEVARDMFVQAIDELQMKVSAMTVIEDQLTSAEQYISEGIGELDRVETMINNLSLPSIELPDVDIGDNAFADGLEDILNAGGDVVESGVNEAIATINQEFQIVKDSLSSGITEIRQQFIFMQTFLTEAKRVIVEHKAMLIDFIGTSRDQLSQCDNFEDLFNGILREMGQVIGLEDEINVETLRAEWDESWSLVRQAIDYIANLGTETSTVQGKFSDEGVKTSPKSISDQSNFIESSPIQQKVSNEGPLQLQDNNLDLTEAGGHPSRNQHNQFPTGRLTPADGSSNPNFEYREGSTDFIDEAGRIWTMLPDSKNVYHQPPEVVDGFFDNLGQDISAWWNETERDPFPNKKFISEDGTGGSFEAILQPDEDGSYGTNWLNSGTQQGTYNFYSPEGVGGNLGHFFFDVLPHYVNDEYDSTPTQQKSDETLPPFSLSNGTSGVQQDIAQRMVVEEEEEEIQLKVETTQFMIGDEEEEEVQMKEETTQFMIGDEEEEEEIQMKDTGSGVVQAAEATFTSGSTSINHTNETNNISGTYRQIKEQLAGPEEDGSITTSISDISYESEDGSSINVDITVSMVKTMPNWTDFPRIQQLAQDESEPQENRDYYARIVEVWNTFMASLNAHEEAHKAIDVREYGNIHTVLYGKTVAEMNATLDTREAAIAQLHEEFHESAESHVYTLPYIQRPIETKPDGTPDDHPVQFKSASEEIQMKANTAQLMIGEEEEEEIQMKANTAQLMIGDEEEEEVQMKADTAQLMIGDEEEEEVQMKANTAQLMIGDEEEEEVQMKANSAQLMIGDEEEEEVQMKAAETTSQLKTDENGKKGNIDLNSNTPQLKKEQSNETTPQSNDQKSNLTAEVEKAFSSKGVQVHKESSKATEVGALAFAQGKDIHFAPGQYNPETKKGQELIGHELHHITQQSQGRVKPTTQRGGVNINDDKGLEKEADDFGVKFAQSLQSKKAAPSDETKNGAFSLGNAPLQKKAINDPTAPMQLAEAEGGSSEGSGPISVDGSQTVVKGLMTSPALPLFDKVKTAPAELNAAMSSESSELKSSFPNIEQPTGIENQPLPQSPEGNGGVTSSPHDIPMLGYAGQGGQGDVTAPSPVTSPHDIPMPGAERATATPPSPVPSAGTPPASTSVSIGEETVDYSAGPRPPVDTSGEADPAQMTTQETADTSKVQAELTSANTHINEDHGENDIYPHYAELEMMSPEVEIPQGQQVTIPEMEALPASDPEIDAAFNGGAQEKLSADMAEHVAANDAEVTKMQTGSQEEWTSYETQKTEEEARVKAEQETAQQTAKTEVSTQQQNWQTENDAVKQKFVDDAAAAKTDYQGQIDTEISTTEANVESTLTQAEVDAQVQVDEAERQAAEKERESEEKESGGFFGWLADKATKAWNWLKDQFNAIINWLKEAVTAIIEAAKEAANRLIEAARRAITGLIRAFGELLKTFVDIAFAAFPEIRDRIKGLIDTAVETAVETVNTLADGLKAFVNALLDALGNALKFLLDAYQRYINFLFSAIEFIVAGLYELYKGLTNLALSAKQSPGQFMGQLQEEFLGMNLSDPLPFERASHPPASHFRPPVEGEVPTDMMGDMPPVLQKDPLTAEDIDVTAVNEPAGPELSEDILNTIPDGGEQEFGGSGIDELDLLRQAYATADEGSGDIAEDAPEMTEADAYPYAHLADDPQARADAELDDFLANQPAPDGASASKDSGGSQADAGSIDDSMKIGPFTQGQRFRYLRTQMWNGITSWFNANKVAIIAGIVGAVVAGIALIIASGGAVLSLIPPLMTILGAFFLGEALVKAGVYLKNFLTKAWGGGAGIADGAKDFARAMVIMVVELIFILLFDLNTVIKAARAGLKGSLRMAAQGARNTGRALVSAGRRTAVNIGRNMARAGRGVLNVAKSGTKITANGLRRGFSRGVKSVGDLMERVKNLNFRKFKLVRSGRFFRLYGKVNPWVLLASGRIEEVNIKRTDSVGDMGTYTVKGGDETVEGILIGKRDNPTPSAFVENAIKNNEEGLEQGQELFENLSSLGSDGMRKTAISRKPHIDYEALADEIGEASANAIKEAHAGRLATNTPNKPPGIKMEAHHILPVETVGKSELLRQAIEGGFEFNSEMNGRWLKRWSSKIDELADGVHASHPSYTAEVLNRLNAAQARLSRRGKEITPEIARREVEKIVTELGSLLDRNSALVNPAKVDDLFKPVRGVSEQAFVESVQQFAKDPELGKRIYDLWKNQDWAEIERIFKENNLNSYKDIIYPPMEGFTEITEAGLKPGTIIDRYGGRIVDGEFVDTGKYVAPGNASFESRALPASAADSPYRRYRVVKEIEGVHSGPAIPWFGQSGMGTQHKLPIGIDQLLKDGVIELID